MPLKIRPITKSDLGAAVALQSVQDPDFDKPMLPGYGWDEARIAKAVGTFKSKKLGTRETRVWVAEDEGRIVGLVAYEFDDQEFVIRLLASDSTIGRSKLIDFVVGKARDGKRTDVSFLVSDYDHENLKLLTQTGWNVKLEPRAFDGFADGWRCHLDLRARAGRMASNTRVPREHGA